MVYCVGIKLPVGLARENEYSNCVQQKQLSVFGNRSKGPEGMAQTSSSLWADRATMPCRGLQEKKNCPHSPSCTQLASHANPVAKKLTCCGEGAAALHAGSKKKERIFPGESISQRQDRHFGHAFAVVFIFLRILIE